MLSSKILSLVALAAVTACAPKIFPVQIKQCDTILGKNSVLITARVFNGSDRAVKDALIAIDFYNNFKFVRVSGSATFATPLGVNDTASVPVIPTVPPAGIAGQAQRCQITHVDYVDGSSADDSSLQQ